MAKLSAEDISAVFHVFDENGEDALNTDDLQNALRLLGIDLTPTELTEAIKEEVGRGSLTEAEFRAFIRDKFGDMDYKQRCMDSFGEFVEDKPGHISLETIRRILTMMGDAPLDDDKVAELLDSIKKDADGLVNLQELVDFMYNRDGLTQESNGQ